MSKGLATREMIISTSADLFNKFGYHGCSLSDIMKATNLKKGGIYNHFKNKDEIAFEAFDYSFNRIKKLFRSRLDLDNNATEKINSIIEIYAELLKMPGMEGGCPIFNTAIDSANTHPLLQKKANIAISTLKRYIEIKIEEGIAAKEFKQGAADCGLSSLIIMTMEGAMVMSRLNGEESINIAVNSLKSFVESYVIKK